MSRGVRLRDGVEVVSESGDTVVFDGAASEDAGEGSVTVVSHAHGDHLASPVGPFVASELTAALSSVRQDGPPPTIDSHSAIDLHNAGHIAGSRAAKLTDAATGRTYLYTGDCSVRDRFYIDGFEPPAADVLIIETTYGEPSYSFPPTTEVVAEIHDWLEATMSEVVVLFGYALGRAQKLQRILAESTRSRVFVTDAIASLSAVIEGHLDVEFEGRRYDGDVDLEPGDALLLPMQTSRLSWIESLVDTHDAVTAGFSGWATDRSFVYRRGFDEGFVLSDHCDFDELVSVVQRVDPDIVYTHHGFAEPFARHLTSEHGYETRALKRNQSTFADF